MYMFSFFLNFFIDKSCNLSKIVSVLRSASVERFDVSRMRGFLAMDLFLATTEHTKRGKIQLTHWPDGTP